MVGIIIVVYNLDVRVFRLQMESIKKFCKDDYTIEVIDNSTDNILSEKIYHAACDFDVNYSKISTVSIDPSHSHAAAANLAFKNLYAEYDYFFFLDHDCIPYKAFSVIEILGNNIAAGVQQGFENKYFWAGCFMFSKEVNKKFINFNPIHSLRIDTGGHNYKIFKNNTNRCKWFSEVGIKNETIEDEFYYFYLLLNDTFIHFLNTSNWRGVPKNKERIDSLLEITKKLHDTVQ